MTRSRYLKAVGLFSARVDTEARSDCLKMSSDRKRWARQNSGRNGRGMGVEEDGGVSGRMAKPFGWRRCEGGGWKMTGHGCRRTLLTTKRSNCYRRLISVDVIRSGVRDRGRGRTKDRWSWQSGCRTSTRLDGWVLTRLMTIIVDKQTMVGGRRRTEDAQDCWTERGVNMWSCREQKSADQARDRRKLKKKGLEFAKCSKKWRYKREWSVNGKKKRSS